MAPSLDDLEQQAIAAAKQLGHSLGAFEPDPTYGTRFANCRTFKCAAGVVVDPAPGLPELAITGDGVTHVCQRLIAEARRKVLATAPEPRTTERTFQVRSPQRVYLSASYARQQVYARDLGVCQKCNRDTDAVWHELVDTSFNDHVRYTALYDSLIQEGFPAHRLEQLSLWDMDHLTPVVEGGGWCDLDNLRTLCLPCHKTETARLLAELGVRRVKEEAAVQSWLRSALARRGLVAPSAPGLPVHPGPGLAASEPKPQQREAERVVASPSPSRQP